MHLLPSYGAVIAAVLQLSVNSTRGSLNINNHETELVALC